MNGGICQYVNTYTVTFASKASASIQSPPKDWDTTETNSTTTNDTRHVRDNTTHSQTVAQIPLEDNVAYSSITQPQIAIENNAAYMITKNDIKPAGDQSPEYDYI